MDEKMAAWDDRTKDRQTRALDRKVPTSVPFSTTILSISSWGKRATSDVEAMSVKRGTVNVLLDA
jgi:hypothetical protein